MGEMNLSGASAPLRLLVAERSNASREGPLSDCLDETDDIEVVARAQKAIEALTLVEQLHPDAVLLDIDMPGETLGFVLDLLKRHKPAPAVLVVIPYASSVLRERALEGGADYVFARTGDPERLLKVLQKIPRIGGGHSRSWRAEGRKGRLFSIL